jgi:hypothetical protein
MVCGNSFNNLSCGSNTACDNPNPQKPYDYAVYTPFVELKVLGEYFTVGNKGANNQAIIESFEMNVISNNGGCSANMVLLTCDFKDVLTLLGLVPKSLCHYDENYLGDGGINGYIKIGWIFNSCNSAGPVRIDNGTISAQLTLESEDAEDLSPYIHAMLQSVTYAYEEGYYKVELHFIDVSAAMDIDRNEFIEGSDDQKQKCWPSIQSMMQRRCDDTQANLDVIKVRLSPDGKTLSPWDFNKSDGGKNGPFGVWNPGQLNNIDATKAVMLSFDTDKDKATVFCFPNQTEKASFVILESSKPNICQGEKRKCPTRTYVVNAGDCTNVLKFTPSFNAVLSGQIESNINDYDVKEQAGRGGGGPGPLSQVPERINICEIFLESTTGVLENKINNSSNGRQISLPANSEDLGHRAASQVLNKIASSVSTDLSSSNEIEMLSSVSATLEIIGDPYWSVSFNVLQGQYVQIIVITPFCVKKNGHCEFLNESKCDNQLSGFYQVLGAKHSIQKGNYTTTLELTKLMADAVDLE